MYNFMPTKAEEQAAAAAAAAAGSSSGQTAAAAAAANKWTIMKALTITDVKNKLVLPKGCPGGAEENILRYLHPDIYKDVMAGKPQIIKMKDVDTNDIIGNMKISKENKLFYIKGQWGKEFVQRRDLQVGQEIGLRWNIVEHYLEFSMLD